MYNFIVNLTDATGSRGRVDRLDQTGLRKRRLIIPPRPRYPMPDFIRDALNARGLMNAYRSRPPYQQNDYIGWITRAKQAATKQKRLDQMLDELERGGMYMKMKWKT